MSDKKSDKKSHKSPTTRVITIPALFLPLIQKEWERRGCFSQAAGVCARLSWPVDRYGVTGGVVCAVFAACCRMTDVAAASAGSISSLVPMILLAKSRLLIICLLRAAMDTV